MPFAYSARMLSVTPKTLLRDLAVGFGVGLILMLGLSYGASLTAHPSPAAKTSAR